MSNPQSRISDRSWRKSAPYLVLVLVVVLVLGLSIAKSWLREEPASAQTSPATEADAPLAAHSPQASHEPAVRPAISPELRQRNAEKAQAEAEAKTKAKHFAYADTYTQEKVDASWAADTETKLLEASASSQIAELKAEPENLDIDCRSSMCKVQADFASRSQAEDWLTLFSLGTGGGLPSSTFQFINDPNGGVRLVYYGTSRQ